MKKLVSVFSLVLLLGALTGNAQIFWTENFESGSTSGTLAGAYGGWTTVSTGTNGSFNNVWYVSCAENGHTAGVCGTGCASVSSTATLATLHIGANTSIGGDVGAAYSAGPLLSQTNMRAQSPTINCTGKYGITLSFYYIENGDGTNDDATLWYYDGTTWSLLVNTPKTPTSTCSPQGQWTHYSIALPVSANNNANVKLGFNWTDNDDGLGSDPSFAVDSMSLKTAGTGGPVVASMTASATTACEDSCITVTNTSTGAVDSFRWTCPTATITGATASPANICFLNTSGAKVVKLYLYNAGAIVDSATTNITVNPAPSPVITKSGTTYSVPALYTTYQWYTVAFPPVPISGATNATYTTTVSGTYAVAVDSAGCSGIAIYGLVGLEPVKTTVTQYWVSETGNGTFNLFAATPPSEPLTVGIYDATGRAIVTETWNVGLPMIRFSDLPLSPGMYIIRLTNSNTSQVLKWLQR